MMDMVDGEIDEPDTGDADADKAILRTMLCTDYEPAKTPGKLRIRSRLRADLLMELARYAHPRLKATDDAGANAQAGVTVEIKNYPSGQSPVTMLAQSPGNASGR